MRDAARGNDEIVDAARFLCAPAGSLLLTVSSARNDDPILVF
jgi:hypothetical protein